MILNTNAVVYFFRKPVDMRRGIDGLINVVVSDMKLDPMSQSIFVFIGRRFDRLKILHYQNNTFWLCYARLQNSRYKWPRHWFVDDLLKVDQSVLAFFLKGCDLNGLKPFEEKKVSYMF